MRGYQKSDLAARFLKDLDIPQGAAAGQITVVKQVEFLYNRVEAVTDPREKGEAARVNKHRHQSAAPAAPPAAIGDHPHRSQEEDEKQNNHNRSEPSRATFQLRLGATARFSLCTQP